MTQPTRQEIDELLRRLQTGSYSIPDIREAAEILFTVQNHAESYQMALDFATSLHEQVRMLGLCMMEKLAPHIESARGFLAGAKDAVKLLQSGSDSSKPAGPDYSAIGEVIKVWLRDSRKSRGRR
jgi:hypothetical protein